MLILLEGDDNIYVQANLAYALCKRRKIGDVFRVACFSTKKKKGKRRKKKKEYRLESSIV